MEAYRQHVRMHPGDQQDWSSEVSWPPFLSKRLPYTAGQLVHILSDMHLHRSCKCEIQEFWQPSGRRWWERKVTWSCLWHYWQENLNYIRSCRGWVWQAKLTEENLLWGASERHTHTLIHTYTYRHTHVWTRRDVEHIYIWKHFCSGTVSVHLAPGTAESPDTHWEREKEGENRDKRMPGQVGTHAWQGWAQTRRQCWGDTGVCRIQGRRRYDGLRGAGRDRGPLWTVELTPVKQHHHPSPYHWWCLLWVSLFLFLYLVISPHFKPSSRLIIFPLKPAKLLEYQAALANATLLP